jgi:hypothetical protein
MKNIEALRLEADRSRAHFLASASKLTRNLSPSRLMNDAVGALQPSRHTLQDVGDEIRRNPLALLAALGGLWLFFQQVSRKPTKTRPATRPRQRSPRMSRAISKGEEHGHHPDQR